KTVSVKWHYEEDDEDMLEAGEDYDAIIDIAFDMVKVEEI
ncbi:MAG: SiaC family regulatory phosphoprotein, partial [Cryomorphaceae bacterium]